ncbi:hypothetical protein [Adhaeribacter aerolatus]|uniref:hypothetical protein n=1 Tax=Adhaeribacter aerolatus TaxID=670289 RepID=UPI001478F5FE|nr:hypothetical protein [Adhaeribacter aerolatus]
MERITALAILSSPYLININLNGLVVSKIIFVFAESVFTGIGLLASLLKTYQIFCFWKQYSGGQKLRRAFGITLLMIFLIIIICLNLRILELYLS